MSRILISFKTKSLILIGALVLASCTNTTQRSSNQEVATSTPSVPSRLLLNSQPSPQALANKVLEKLTAKDRAGLKALVITQEEFCNYLWPEFPAYGTPGATCDWVWGMDEAKSNSSLGGAINRLGGKEFKLLAIDFKEKPQIYKTYKIHMHPLVTVQVDGEELKGEVFGPVVELDGQYKLYSFYTRE
ncbi:MAG: hypothetical protein JNN15_14225 [Blastocatellia bacterium]|nr:hypothetical protein [Blastocatellia bacterium]